MASDEADIAVGLTFSMTGFTNLNAREVVDFTLPEAAKEMVDITHQESESGLKFRAKKLKDPGSMILILHHNQDYDYYADVDSADKPVLCNVTMPSGATLAFYGILARYTPQGATLNEKMLAECEIKLSNDTVSGTDQDITVTAAA